MASRPPEKAISALPKQITNRQYAVCAMFGADGDA
jgi:hypothetical protein